MPTGNFGLYIHVPFCGSICSYCHFARTADHQLTDRGAFVAGVLAELELRLENCSVLRSGRRSLTTAYIGGGTPSQLEPELMTRLVTGTVGRLNCGPDLELTVEANPESLDLEKVESWRGVGINRISLGVQSLDEKVLQLLGRSCDPDSARRALKLATANFNRVSADWIIGPGLRREQLLAELSQTVDMGVTHFSLYILEVHPGTRLESDLASRRVTMPSDEQTEVLYLAAGEHLENLGLMQYEVANFALPGHESRHNQGYWRGTPWLAVGPSGHGYWGRRRYANHETTSDWLSLLAKGQLPEASVDRLDRPARRLEQAILALRTRGGLSLDLIPDGAFDLDRGVREGLWELHERKLVLTRRGFLRIDSFEERLAACL